MIVGHLLVVHSLLAVVNSEWNLRLLWWCSWSVLSTVTRRCLSVWRRWRRWIIHQRTAQLQIIYQYTFTLKSHLCKHHSGKLSQVSAPDHTLERH